MYRYLIYLNQQLQNPIINLLIKPGQHNIESELDEDYDDINLCGDGLINEITQDQDLSLINFSNGIFKFKVREGTLNNIYYRPPNSEIILES